MFSFYAFFWNNDVYINEKYKYAANEILTAYLNTDYLNMAEEYIYELRRLCRKLLIYADMDYEDYAHYNNTVREASSLFRKINRRFLALPPYNKLFENSILFLEDVLNQHSFVFDDGIKDYGSTIITWDTVTETGYGEELEHGSFIFT